MLRCRILRGLPPRHRLAVMPDGKSGSRYRSKLAEGLRALRLVRRRPTVNNIGPRTTARRERLGAGSRDPSSALQPPAALCSSPHARCCAHLVAARSAWLARLPDRPAARVCAQAAAPDKSYELEVRAECDDAGERAASRPSARPRQLARPPASQCLRLARCWQVVIASRAENVLVANRRQLNAR